MKVLALSVVAVFAALSCLDLANANASYFAHCQGTIAIKKIHKRSKGKFPRVKVTFVLVKILSTRGHSRTACNKFLKKNETRWFSVPKGLKGKVRVGAKLRARYSEMDGMTPTGVHSSNNWSLMRPKPAKPPKPPKG